MYSPRRIKLLFIVVITLFGVLNLGALAALSMDRRQRATIMARLTAPECGFCTSADGAYLWRFTLDPLEHDLAAPSGTAVALCTIIGTPYARLRAAIPDEWFNDGFGCAVGRRQAFSRAAMPRHEAAAR